MPTILKIGSFRFHFYSDEGQEPAHIHVRTNDGECKFWLARISLADNRGVRPHDLREIERHVYNNQALLLKAFYDNHSR